MIGPWMSWQSLSKERGIDRWLVVTYLGYPFVFLTDERFCCAITGLESVDFVVPSNQ